MRGAPGEVMPRVGMWPWWLKFQEQGTRCPAKLRSVVRETQAFSGHSKEQTEPWEHGGCVYTAKRCPCTGENGSCPSAVVEKEKPAGTGQGDSGGEGAASTGTGEVTSTFLRNKVFLCSDSSKAGRLLGPH